MESHSHLARYLIGFKGDRGSCKLFLDTRELKKSNIVSLAQESWLSFLPGAGSQGNKGEMTGLLGI